MDKSEHVFMAGRYTAMASADYAAGYEVRDNQGEIAAMCFTMEEARRDAEALARWPG